MVRTANRSLFPNGYLPPPPIHPTPEEQAVIRECLAERIKQAIPGESSPIVPSAISFISNHWLLGWIAPLVLGAQSSAWEQTVRDILDPLSSGECNSHLVMFVPLITLIPEMGNTTDASMMDGPPPMVRTQSQLTPSGGCLTGGVREREEP